MLDAVTILLDGRVSFITPILTEFRILMSLPEHWIWFFSYISDFRQQSVQSSHNESVS